MTFIPDARWLNLPNMDHVIQYIPPHLDPAQAVRLRCLEMIMEDADNSSGDFYHDLKAAGEMAEFVLTGKIPEEE